jgi:hypothetical protein
MPTRFKSMRRRGPAAELARVPDDDLRTSPALDVLLMLGGLAFTLLLIDP